MDTSETYIKMCEKAEKIQRKWKPAEADFMYNYSIDKVAFIRVNRITDKRRRHHSIGYNEDRFFWLPRQDQLQEIIKQGTLESDSEITKAFGDWCYPAFPCGIMASMEQLWLAFVMKEKYNKTWEGEDWK